MAAYRPLAALVLPLALASAPAMAQVSHETKTSTDTSVHDGVATRTTRVEHVKKIKTNQPKKILGVEVGHKTRTTKTVETRSASTNGDHSASVKVSH